MVAETPSLSAADSSHRRRWIPWLAAFLLAALVAIVALTPSLRALAASTWREMLSISPRLLALIFLLKTGQALYSALVWRNALLCAWPNRPLPYGFVLGVEQGQIAVNTVMPARAGTWAMLGIFAYAIGNVRPAKLVAVWGVQGFAYGVFAAISYAIIAIGIPNQAGGDDGPVARVRRLATDRPALATAMVIVLAVAVVIGLVLARRKLPAARQQAIEGLAIIRPPARYLRLLFLPALISYAFGVASYIVLLHAFGIPVTIFTLALALGSNALGGAIRITPGGLGTSQALDVIALTAHAPAEVVTAYSLSEIAITAVVSIVISIVALVASTGFRGTRHLIGELRRGEFGGGLQALNARQRAMRQRVGRLPRKP